MNNNNFVLDPVSTSTPDHSASSGSRSSFTLSGKDYHDPDLAPEPLVYEGSHYSLGDGNYVTGAIKCDY